MNDPQQIRRALGDIRRALESYPREGLAEILALLFKEYVIEGGQPIASAGQVLDARSDLEGLTFAELIVWLQTHLDLPELALFEVSGADVSVRVDGRTARLRAAPTPVVAPPAPATPQAVTPPIVRAAPIAPSAAPAPPVTAAAPAPAAGAKEEPAPAETGTRFSLLEVD